MIVDQAQEQLIAKGTNVGAYVTSTGTVAVGVWDLSDIGVIVGIVCTIVTTGANIYYQRKRARRDKKD